MPRARPATWAARATPSAESSLSCHSLSSRPRDTGKTRLVGAVMNPCKGGVWRAVRAAGDPSPSSAHGQAPGELLPRAAVRRVLEGELELVSVGVRGAPPDGDHVRRGVGAPRGAFRATALSPDRFTYRSTPQLLEDEEEADGWRRVSLAERHGHPTLSPSSERSPHRRTRNPPHTIAAPVPNTSRTLRSLQSASGLRPLGPRPSSWGAG
jgi:hypothetical protein